MVIDAIAAGQKAAIGIDRALRERKGEKPWVEPVEKIEVPFEIDADVVEQPQWAMPEAPAGDRRRDFREVELGYSVQVALAEARRCLRCDGKGE